MGLALIDPVPGVPVEVHPEGQGGNEDLPVKGHAGNPEGFQNPVLPMGSCDGIDRLKRIPVDSKLLQPPFFEGFGIPISHDHGGIGSAEPAGTVVILNHRAFKAASSRESLAK